MSICRRFIYSFIALLFYLPINLSGQIDNLKFENFKNFGVLDGLPDNTVRVIFQDRMGFLWLGTQNGLVRYDGYNMSAYQYDPGDPNSLYGVTITTLYEDAAGDIWVGTFRNGLNRFDRSTETFTSYLPSQYNASLFGMITNLQAAGPPIAAILGAGDDVDSSKVFTLQDETTLLITVMGEGVGEDLWDYGWIEDLDSNIVWQMDRKKLFWAGGHPKNKIQMVLKTLPAGSYRLRYHSDVSHSFGQWNQPAPLYPHLWGIQLLDVKDKTVLETVLAVQDFQEKVPFDNISGISGTAEGNILWITSNNLGLCRIDLRSNAFKYYRTDLKDSTAFPTNVLNCIFIDQEGVIWIGANRGLIRFLPDTEEFTLFQSDAARENNGFDHFSTIYEDHAGTLWLGSYVSGLYKFDRANETFQQYQHDPANPNSLSGNSVISINEDHQGLLWIALNRNGLNIFDKKGHFQHFSHYSDSANHLRGIGTLSIYKDRTDVMWVGTWMRGMYKVNRAREPFKQYRHDPDNPNSLSSNHIESLYEDRSGALWIGTRNGGLNRLTRQTQTAEEDVFKHYWHDPNDPTSMSGNRVLAIHEDRLGNLWFSHGWEGLSRMSRDEQESGTFLRYYHDPDNLKSLSNNGIRTIFEDRSGTIWIGTANGFNQFHPETETFTRHNIDIKNNIITIFEDQFGTFWLGTDGGGVVKYDRNTSQSVAYTFGSISFISATAIHEDAAGRFWIRTSHNGLHLLDRENEEYTHFNDKNNLIAYGIPKMLEDNSGQLWVGRSGGISIFDPKTEIFKDFVRNDELRDLNIFTEFKSPRTGEMFWGGEGGLVIFHPDSIKTNPYPPQVIITELKLFGQALHVGRDSPLKKAISVSDTIQLAYWQNDISLTFAALHFNDPAANQYAYYLENYEDSWQATSTRREAVYTNLDPGEYVFRVKASNNHGLWNEAGKSLWIIIAPPWWKTTWAYISYVLLGILAIFTIIKLRTRQLEERSRELEETVEERTLEIREQHQELETLEGIVRTINKESELEKVLHVLLEQGLALFPQAKKGTFLLRDGDNDLFRIVAANGYDDALIKDVALTEAELVNRYTEQSQQIEKRAYIVREFQESSAQKKMKDFPRPQSLLAMAVVLEERLEGFLVLDNFNSSEAFVDSDVEKLARFRQHAVSAIDKAKRLQEVKAKNAELIRTREQLIVQEKLASLGQLTAGIAHEIKNPLNFVNNFAELLVEMVAEVKEDIEAHKGMLDNETLKKSKEILADADDLLGEISENAHKINEHGKRANNIVNGMLQHSRGKSGEFQSTDLNALLDEYIGLAYHGMRAKNGDFNVTIERDFDESVGEIPLVPQDISRVFLNLLNNAFEAFDIPLGPPSKGEAMVVVSSKNLGEQVAVRIRDNGPGIPEDVRKQIFNPFFTTKPTGQGNTGLGLSISHDIVVKVHRGEISVDSQPGEFTEFVILLPKEKEGVLKK